MDIIKRAILFNAKAIVTVLDTTELVQTAIDTHKYSDSSAKAVGRLLTMCAFMSGNFKSANDKLTLIVQGNGKIGKMVASGDYGAKVRAYCHNPSAYSKINSSVGEIVGKDGQLIVIKDMGMKKPYNGFSQLVNGNIDTDFAYYFTVSEQLPSAVALGCEVSNGFCAKACGVIVQSMPNCEEELLVILEDIVRNFDNVALLMKDMTAAELLDYYFGHFENKILDDIYPQYQCSCNMAKIQKMIFTLGYEQALNIAIEEGKLEVCCEFCNKKYAFDQQQIKELFEQLS